VSGTPTPMPMPAQQQHQQQHQQQQGGHERAYGGDAEFSSSHSSPSPSSYFPTSSAALSHTLSRLEGRTTPSSASQSYFESGRGERDPEHEALRARLERVLALSSAQGGSPRSSLGSGSGSGSDRRTSMGAGAGAGKGGRRTSARESLTSVSSGSAASAGAGASASPRRSLEQERERERTTTPRPSTPHNNSQVQQDRTPRSPRTPTQTARSPERTPTSRRRRGDEQVSVYFSFDCWSFRLRGCSSLSRRFWFWGRVCFIFLSFF
jgi:hypothetical protein